MTDVKLSPPQLPTGEIVEIEEKMENEDTTMETPTDPPEELDGEEIVVFYDTQPCNWYIRPVGKLIEAKNDQSGEKFKGTLKEFNKRLRG